MALAIRKDHFCPFHNLTLDLKGLGVDGPKKKTWHFLCFQAKVDTFICILRLGKKLTLTIQLKNFFSPSRINELD